MDKTSTHTVLTLACFIVTSKGPLCPLVIGTAPCCHWNMGMGTRSQGPLVTLTWPNLGFFCVCSFYYHIVLWSKSLRHWLKKTLLCVCVCVGWGGGSASGVVDSSISAASAPLLHQSGFGCRHGRPMLSGYGLLYLLVGAVYRFIWIRFCIILVAWKTNEVLVSQHLWLDPRTIFFE